MAVADIVEGECDGPIKPGSARGLPGQSIRITEDGSIVKTCLTIVESDLVECPPPLSRVSVHLKISRKSNADVVLFESTVEEVEFCLGRAETARGLEIALATMKPGESALIEVKPSHGFNKLNRPTEFPESAINDTLIFEVDLLRWEHEINIWTVSNHAKVDFAQKQHQLGNQQYSEQKYRTSLKTYKRATDAIELAINEQKDPLPPADLKESKHLLFLCLSNAGACHIRLQNWDEAIFSCTKALTLEPNNVKCLYRRGLAYGRREEYAVALKDLRKAHTIEPNLLVRDAIREVKQAELEANECIRKKLDGFLKNGLDLYADKPDPNGSSLWNYVKLSFLRIDAAAPKSANPTLKLFNNCTLVNGATLSDCIRRTLKEFRMVDGISKMVSYWRFPSNRAGCTNRQRICRPTLSSARLAFTLIALDSPTATAMTTQKEKLKEFRSVCHTTEKISRNYLKQYDWNLNIAIDAYFRENNSNSTQQTISGSKSDLNSLSEIFDKYEDPEDKDVCVAEYMEQFLKDIGCEPEGLHSLALMWKLGASRMGILTRNEFIEGFAKLGCFSIKDMAKTTGSDMGNRLRNDIDFIQFYRWLFDYLKEDEKKRTIPSELALHVWNIVLDKNKFPLLEAYMDFISNNASLIVFNKDLWYQSFEFVRDTDKDLSNFDESGAWPSVVDDFVESLKKSK